MCKKTLKWKLINGFTVYQLAIAITIDLQRIWWFIQFSCHLGVHWTKKLFIVKILLNNNNLTSKSWKINNIANIANITLANSQFVTGERSCYLSLFWVTDYESDVQNALSGLIFFYRELKIFENFTIFRHLTVFSP